jgi:hypothetical protein
MAIDEEKKASSRTSGSRNPLSLALPRHVSFRNERTSYTVVGGSKKEVGRLYKESRGCNKNPPFDLPSAEAFLP